MPVIVLRVIIGAIRKNHIERLHLNRPGLLLYRERLSLWQTVQEENQALEIYKRQAQEEQQRHLQEIARLHEIAEHLKRELERYKSEE
jgi:hypothetical protein